MRYRSEYVATDAAADERADPAAARHVPSAADDRLREGPQHLGADAADVAHWRVEDDADEGSTPPPQQGLLGATERGHTEVVRRLLALGADPNAVCYPADHPDAPGQSPLCLAASLGHTTILELLLDAGANVRHVTSHRHTALMLAKDADAVALLLGAGSDPEHTEINESTALTFAAMNGHGEIVDVLLEHGAHVLHEDRSRWTPLMMAASNGHGEIVARLLAYGGMPDGAVGGRCLLLAIDEEDLGIVQWLLDHGVHVDYARPRDQCTALLWAAQAGCDDIVRVLLAAGADVHHQLDTGCTALTWAADSGHLDVVETLVAAGADLDHREFRGRTALHNAAMEGHLEVIRRLLEAGADPRVTDDDGFTPRELAEAEGQVEATLAFDTSFLEEK